MDKVAAESYIFAKASGNIGKSFVGSRAYLLFEQKSISDLWVLLFKSQPPLLPDSLLAKELETEAFNRFINQYKYFISLYDKPVDILVNQLEICEAENIQSPEPDVKIEFIKKIWKSLPNKLSDSNASLNNLYKEEFILKNITWALRLKIFYKMKKEDIIPKLMYVTDNPDADDPLAAPAIQVLDYPLSNYSLWKKWKYKKYLNPVIDEQNWQVDPSWIENAVKLKIQKMANNLFHQYPNTTTSLIAWFLIKNYELSCIKTAVESLRLNINSEEAMCAVGLLDKGAVNG